MYIVRDIFQLKFGHYRDVKALVDEAVKADMFPKHQQMRVLTDFTGDSYRLVLEQGFNTLSEYEQSLTGSMATEDWQKWYMRFKEHAQSSHREIMRQVA